MTPVEGSAVVEVREVSEGNSSQLIEIQLAEDLSTPRADLDEIFADEPVDPLYRLGAQTKLFVTTACSCEQGRYGYRIAKRLFDVVVSAAAIVVLFIPGVVLCIAIRIESPGNPIYVQRRVGRVGKDGQITTFPMLKFRSMYQGAEEQLDELRELNEADGPLFKIKEDPRVTRIGAFIRRHSIDEAPQFINSLVGSMSIVGPRPALPFEVEQYDEWAMGRLAVKPGLTGFWQTRGRSETSFEDMVAYDLEYVEQRSFWVDIKTICKTIAVVFTGRSAC